MKNTCFLSIMAFALLFIPMSGTSAGGDSSDLLFFKFKHDGKVAYAIYDPVANVTQPVNADLALNGFLVSTTGLVAFSTMYVDDATGIPLIDLQNPDSAPIDIDPNPDTPGQPLAWSPDGTLLALASTAQDGQLHIYIWDGQATVDITPNGLQAVVRMYDEVIWSMDGQLAFTILLDFASNLPGEIYVWNNNGLTELTQSPATGYRQLTWSHDGKLAYYGYNADLEINSADVYIWDGNAPINLSQDPSNYNCSPSWSTDGRVAFLTFLEGQQTANILVWDGVSFKDGAPDNTTFVNVAPDLAKWVPVSLVWTPENHLAFGATDPADNTQQIYIWDSTNVTNFSQNPGIHNSYPRWAANGRWAFTSTYFTEGWTYVHDADNHAILTVQASNILPAWSANGDYLAFCTNALLSVWDGTQIIDITQGQEIRAQWISGLAANCANG